MESDLVNQDVKEYNKFVNNKTFHIKIYKIEKSFEFQVLMTDDYNEILYKRKITFEELYNLNKIFKQYSSIEEIYKVLYKILKDDEINISLENNHQIKLIFLFEFKEKKENIDFLLNPELSINNTIYK